MFMININMKCSIVISCLAVMSIVLLIQTRKTDGKEFTMLALMGLHQYNASSPTDCGKINHVTGVVFYEAMKYIIKVINSKQELLFNNTLAFDLFDTCKSTKKLKNNLSGKILKMWTIHSLGALGPLTSDEAILAAPVLGVFDMPVISYYANGIDLRDRGKYSNFFRTVPSASYQVEAMLDIVRHFKWTYISVVNSHGNEGQRAMDEFYNGVYRSRFCISKRATFPAVATAADFDRAAQNLYSDKKARVIALITTPEDTRNLFLAIKRLGIPVNWFTWVSATSWDTDVHLLDGIEDVANGALILSYASGDTTTDFWKYFYSLTPFTNPDRVFLEYWAEVFNCRWSAVPAPDVCDGSGDLSTVKHLHQHAPVNLIIEAVFKYACAFQRVMEAACPHEKNRTACLQAEIYDKYLSLDLWRQMQVILEMKGQVCRGLGYVDFNEDGGVLAKFTILNLRTKPGFNVEFKKVGEWNQLPTSTFWNPVGEFKIEAHNVQWSNSTTNSTPVSICSTVCPFGFYKKELQTVHNPQCCWQCVKCADDELVLSNRCESCPLTHKPDKARKNCTLLPIKYAHIDGVLPAISIGLTVVGLLATTFVLIVFIMYHTSRIVKATSRELSIIILVGIYLGFASPFIYLSPPTIFICGVQRLISGLALSLCFAPLFLRLNRIYRIFQSARTQITRPPMVSPISQVLISLCIVTLQMLLGLVWIVASLPHVVTRHPAGTDYVIKSCDTSEISIMMNLMVSLALIVMCTWYAFKTRKFPKNFNESQSIGITMYITCLLWAVFVTLFMFTSDNNDTFMRSFLTCLFATISSYVLLGGLFGPKVYILLVPNMQHKDPDGNYTSYQTRSSDDIITNAKDEKEFHVYRVSNNGIDVATTTSDLMTSWWKNGNLVQ